MKKKLNEIFDEMSPSELEAFGDALSAPELEEKELAAIKERVHATLKIKKKRSPARVWLRVGIIAACLAVVVGTMVLLPLFFDDSPDQDYGTDFTPIIFDATVSPDKLQGNSFEFVVGSSVPPEGEIFGDTPAFEFSGAIAVKARVVKNYPDKYYKLEASLSETPTAYRLVQMQTLEVINGANVPQEFIYLMPEQTYVDLSVYDSLLIAMTQVGVNNYVMQNETQNRIECLDMIVFADHIDKPEFGRIIAFSDGIFDESLWQNENWLFGYQFSRYFLDNPDKSHLVVARGDSESEVISAIKKEYSEWSGGEYPVPSVVVPDFKTEEAKAAMEYVKPFVNGVFAQEYQYPNDTITFRRYINGCQTEETVKIDPVTEEVTYSSVRYTEEDMARIENIAAHLSEKAREYAEQLPNPPHLDTEGMELKCLNLCAWYAKVDGKLYGVIKTSWWYYRDEYNDHFDRYQPVRYYDDAYVLYDVSAGTATDISKDDLINIVGEHNVYPGGCGRDI